MGAFFFWIIVGGIAGFIAEKVMNSSMGLIANIILGIIGAFIGGWLFSFLGFGPGAGWIGSIITATIGAIILIFVARLIKGRS